MTPNPLPCQATARAAGRRLACSVTVLAAALGLNFLRSLNEPATSAEARPERLTARSHPTVPATKPLTVGEEVRTRAGERRRLVLTDGSVVYVNENTALRLAGEQRLTLARGEVFVAAVPSPVSSLAVTTPERMVTGRAAQFAVRASTGGTGILVTRGRVEVSGLDNPLHAGQLLAPGDAKPVPAPRASHLLAWTRPLMAAADMPLVPGSPHAGGALIALDPDGQEAKLSLRKYRVDVHIEDGFARTTIDQTYFNHTPSRLEGTFCFPLPPDASLSRLAMYVDGTLMEGGMVERDYGRQVFETIVYRQKDPALLEWVDGSTFKMRVFPLEGRQEKRLVLSYTQKLPTLYGRTTYRFPTGHSLGAVRDWSFHARVKDGAALGWGSETPDVKATRDSADLLLDAAAQDVKLGRDVTLTLSDPSPPLPSGERGPGGEGESTITRFASAEHEGARYLMLRYRPELPNRPQSQRRDWVVLFESSGDRDPLLARTQIEIVRALLAQAEPDDTFAVLAPGTRVHAFAPEARPVTPENIQAAIAFLEGVHLIGAFDLERTLHEAEPFLKAGKDPHLVHVGSGIAAMGEQRADVLAKSLPDGVRYVGVGVGRRWGRDFMKQAAERTGGYFTQINPDEPISWRAFELSATLNTPRLLDVRVAGAADRLTFLSHASSIAQGEEVCAIARLGPDAKDLPPSVTVTGTLDGQPFRQDLPVKQVAEHADYLPRTWAQLEIDRLLAADTAKHKDKIIALSKAMYVMTPFTSLLVLENEDMYVQYKVDRGRKDHWAKYPCPAKIPVVYEPLPGMPGDVRSMSKGTKPTARQVRATVLVRARANYVEAGKGNYQKRILENEYTSSRKGALVARYQTLFKEGKYRDAEMFAIRAHELDPDDAMVSAMVYQARTQRRLIEGGVEGHYREELFTSSLNDVEDQGPPATIRTPLIVSPEDWKSARRRKGHPESLEFYRLGKREDQIKRKLNSPISLNFENAPLKQVFDDLATITDINIVLDLPALSEDGISLDQPVTMHLDAVSLNSALTLLLHQVHLTYFIRDDVIQITTQSYARGKQIPPGSPMMDLFIPFANHSLSATADTMSVLGQNQNSWARSLDGYLLPSITYGRPSLGGDERLFYDLVAYAPGMNTRQADIQAVLEATGAADPHASSGRIDPAARKLIDRARASSWQALTFPAEDGQPAHTIIFDGSGRHAYERTLPPGVRERVICDGQTLLHLYPDLGIGARRSVSRFHRAEFAGLVPWVLPPAEDLARGADLKLIDPNTIAVIPCGADSAKGRDGKGLPYTQLHLVFAEDGRLAERRLVEMPGKKTLFRQLCIGDGVVKLLDADGKQLAVRKGTLAAVQAPNLTADTKNLVVLPLPYRSHDHVRTALKIENTRYEDLRFADALALFAADFAAGNGDEALKVFRQAFHGRDQRQIGFYVLLAACGQNLDSEHADVLAEHLNEPLAQYLALYSSPVLRKHASQWAVATGQWGDGFLHHLAVTHALYQHWQNDRAGLGTEKQKQAERTRALDYVRRNKGSVFGWGLLCLLQDRAGKDAAFHRSLADLCPLFADVPGLAYAARYEQARCLWKAGQREEARKQFRALYEKTLKDNLLPPIDTDFREALAGSGQEPDLWSPLLRQTAEQQIAQKRRPAVLALAWLCWQLNDPLLANQMVQAALDGVPEKERLPLTLAAIDYLLETAQLAQADALLQKLLDDPKLAGRARLWRLGLQIAERRDRKTRALACLERALDAEYQDPPAVLNLQAVREEYGQLLEHYQRLADAMVTLQIQPPADFQAKVVRTADRRRALDSDGTSACQAAARILQTLGERELAWDYLTTPVGLRPRESAPWVDLAQVLGRQGELDLADRAFSAAFAAEPTNAQLLWDRAQNLRQAGKAVEAHKLYRQLAEGQWQPRFTWIQAQAQRQVNNHN
jgi:hypothetical protein